MSLTVLLLEKIHDVAEAQLKEAGFTVRRVNAALKEDELIESANAKDLLAIGAFCIGTNQIALADAMKHGVCVFNAPFSNTRSVAELVIAEVIMLSRQLGDRDMEMHQGVWKKLATGSHEVRGKTLGIVGYGHIGSQVGVLAEFFGMRVLYYDVATKLPLSNNTPCRTLDEVLKASDFVTLHVPETPQTKGLIGRKQLEVMKKEACLINASRGTVVDLEALAERIKSGHLGGAAVDVYPDEPEGNESKGFVTPLQHVPNVILTPHIGGSTEEAQAAIGREVAAALVKFVNGGATTGSVNFPHVELPALAGAHRILNAHKNVPGVLRDITRIVSEKNANVVAQVLATDPNVGYLVMDLEEEVAVDVYQAIAALETSIKTRILY
jgi:D-3-phosphoglycerate dehydrogenase